MLPIIVCSGGSAVRATRIAFIAIPLSLFALSVCLFVRHVVRAAGPQRLSAEEIAALIVGNALPQDIVHHISVDGIDFRPDDSYLAQLRAMGPDPSVITAVQSATVDPKADALDQSERTLLQHYANAAEKMKKNDFDGAEAEMAAVVKSSLEEAEAGFVMGEIYRLQDEFEKSMGVYDAVLTIDGDFPETRAKLSYIEGRMGDPDEAMKQAKMALAEYADDPEAYKNECFAYDDLSEYNAGLEQCRKALQLKPDYGSANLGLGINLLDGGDLDNALAQFQIAFTLDNSAVAAYDIGLVHDKKGQLATAITYYRKAKELDPNRYDARENLASALLRSGQAKDAVAEFHEMEQKYPGSEICHFCTGNALFQTWDLDGAEKEYREAIRLNPSDPDPYVMLGRVRLQQQRYDDVLSEVRPAKQLDPANVDAYNVAGQALLGKKDYAGAEAQFKRAVQLKPGDPSLHDFDAQALAGERKPADAITEYKQSLTLDPTNDQVAIRLAHALEDSGEWADAMDQYRKAAMKKAGVDLLTLGPQREGLNPEKEYESAQERFNAHITELKASGKSAEAGALTARIADMQKVTNLSDKMDSLMQAGMQAVQKQKIEEGLSDFQNAVAVGRQMQPHDARLATALEYVGNYYLNLGHDFSRADAFYEEQLKVDDEIYGPQSTASEVPLEMLGDSAMLQKNYGMAEKFFFAEVDLESKTYGESNDRVAMKLVNASKVFLVQQQYDKAEPYLLRAENIMESTYGPDNPALEYPLANLCMMYDKWNKPDKAVGCYSKYVASAEKEFGDSSPKIVPVLTAQAAALRAAGRTADADATDKRANALRGATMQANSN
jgi:tetratricopeptide (TPR) repeat protein